MLMNTFRVSARLGGVRPAFFAFAQQRLGMDSSAAAAVTGARVAPLHARVAAKRPSKQGGRAEQKSKKAKKRDRDAKSGTNEELVALDVQHLRVRQGTPTTEGEEVPEKGSEVEVEVKELSSNGSGLAQQAGSQHIYVVPFVVPGDTLKVKVFRHLQPEGYIEADLVSVTKPSTLRDDSRIRCKYFATCAGCQFQMLDYAEQLRIKRRVLEKAFRNFSDLPQEVLPAVQETIGSPLQYGYRTKLTPHFERPKGHERGSPFNSRPPIGFTPKGCKRSTIDIEECPIGTDVLQLGLARERARVGEEFGQYIRGATILLRESTKRTIKTPPSSAAAGPAEGEQTEVGTATPPFAVRVETDEYVDIKTCVSDNNATSIEYVKDYKLANPAGAFFQNNNSILPTFIDYIREQILPPASSRPIKYLIDAYSGSGLFTITLSSLFQGSTGIDISEQSIKYARRNAHENKLPESQCKFIAADAGKLFRKVTYPADETVVVLDPPRKGCDAGFLSQLLGFGPKRVVYVSCNVHTQARDVGMLVRGETGIDAQGGEGGREGSEVRYELESVRGFDFFPQTAHVEGVAVLNRV